MFDITLIVHDDQHMALPRLLRDLYYNLIEVNWW